MNEWFQVHTNTKSSVAGNPQTFSAVFRCLYTGHLTTNAAFQAEWGMRHAHAAGAADEEHAKGLPAANGAMFMRWKTALWALPALVPAAYLLFALQSIFSASPWRIEYWMEIRSGNAIIANIEDFRKKHGRLPDPESPGEVIPLGFRMSAAYIPQYRVTGEYYEIEYNIGFDGPDLIYSSRAREWRCHLC